MPSRERPARACALPKRLRSRSGLANSLRGQHKVQFSLRAAVESDEQGEQLLLRQSCRRVWQPVNSGTDHAAASIEEAGHAHH